MTRIAALTLGGLAVAVAAGTQLAGMWSHASAAAGTEVLGAPVSAHGLSLECRRRRDRPGRQRLRSRRLRRRSRSWRH